MKFLWFHIFDIAQILGFQLISKHFFQCHHFWHDVGTEELAHLEIVGAVVRQLMKNATTAEIENSPAGAYFINHNRGVYAANSNGSPFNAFSFASTGDPIADLNEDLAADAATL